MIDEPAKIAITQMRGKFAASLCRFEPRFTTENHIRQNGLRDSTSVPDAIERVTSVMMGVRDLSRLTPLGRRPGQRKARE